MLRNKLIAAAAVAAGLIVAYSGIGPARALSIGYAPPQVETQSVANVELAAARSSGRRLYYYNRGGYRGGYRSGSRYAYRGRGYGRSYGRYRYAYPRRYRYANRRYYGGYGYPWWGYGGAALALGFGGYYGYGGAYGYDGGYGYDDDYAYEGGNDHVQWCLNRYRSYDPRTDTFLGYDGRRHRCRAPY